MEKANNENIRSASHAGSWYSANKSELKNQIKIFFSNSKNFLEENASRSFLENKLLKAVIVPHAGYRYSGPTAAWAYISINKELYKRIVILGPSHHEYIEGCGLSKFDYIETPFGNLKIDKNANEILHKSLYFKEIDGSVDEEEHSLEMQFPFVKYIFENSDIQVLPIMVGDLNAKMQEEIADALLDFYKDKNTLFVVSSDFCHWGKRFRYTYYDKSCGKIHESIEKLDKMGMEAIESLSPKAFQDYITSYKNTICGRKPISILLSIINKFNQQYNINANNEEEFKDNFIKFVQYNQSSKVIEENDSSVSYAVGLNLVDKEFLI